jgi:hypothetical protein
MSGWPLSNRGDVVRRTIEDKAVRPRTAIHLQPPARRWEARRGAAHDETDRGGAAMTESSGDPTFHWPEEDPAERAREAELPAHEQDPADGSVREPDRSAEDEPVIDDPRRIQSGGRSG